MLQNCESGEAAEQFLGYQKKKESSNIVRAGTSFCSTVESMKQISENYLNNEKCYVNDWAAYISSVGMTREEVIEYISKTNTQPERQEAAMSIFKKNLEKNAVKKTF